MKKYSFFLLFGGIILLFILSFHTIIEADDSISLAFVGDIMLAGNIEPLITQFGPEYPFLTTTSILQKADIAFCNLENPLTNASESCLDKEFLFKAKPHVIKGLVSAGFDVVSLANNHIMDYGDEGLLETLQILDKNQIKPVGAGMNLSQARQRATFKVKDRKITFLAYSNTFPITFYATKDSPGTAPGYLQYLQKDIEKAKGDADIIIVSFHWSSELLDQPKDYQIDLAHKAIDFGATIVVGHHPHVLQGIEIYRKGLIMYSLGNFVFGSYSKKVKESIILICEFKENRLNHTEIIPLSVNNLEVEFQPQILKDKEALKVINHLRRLSSSFETKISFKKNRGIISLSSSSVF